VADPAVPISVRRVHAVSERELAELTDVLIDVVDGGASVGFMHPLTRTKALAFWRGVADAVGRGDRALLVAEDAIGIVGTVQLVLLLPENQPHRADLSKMIVHRRGRRRGVGAELLVAAEETARDCSRTLLVLDTASADAERLYVRGGWLRVGVVPDFALMPDGAPCDTTFFYRQLGASSGSTTGRPPTRRQISRQTPPNAIGGT
jgi:GNAT superfamily N-acetyltransferase